MQTSFDKYAGQYDSWFIANPNVLKSEILLVAEVLKNGGKILSVGCGSGLFESILVKEHGIKVKHGIEPAKAMAEIAIKRGLDVEIATAEEGDFGKEEYDTIIFNGSPGYIARLDEVVAKAFEALPKGGKLILVDIPKESGYGSLYNLAKALGSWENPLVADVAPKIPYPIEFVAAANWRTTAEKIDILKRNGFSKLSFMQTLTTHPMYSDDKYEYPTEGYDKGDYVAITAVKA